MNPFKIIGIVGMVFIVIGILLRKRVREDVFYIIGGALLLAYSIHIKDAIFIILQIVFIITAVYDFVRLRFVKHR